MLPVLLALTMLAAAPEPTPTPAPLAPVILATPTPAPQAQGLKTIAHIRTTALCSAFRDHANNAIVDLTDDDAALTRAIGALRTADFRETNLAKRFSGEQTLNALELQLGDSAHGGLKDVDALRALAAHAQDSAQKRELLAFADALAGALGRQQKIASDVGVFLNRLTLADSMREDRESELGVAASTVPSLDDLLPSSDGVTSALRSIYGSSAPSYTAAADAGPAVADEFARRVPLIQADEQAAAVHIPGAIAGC